MTTATDQPDLSETSIDLGVVVGAVLRRIVRIGLVTILLCIAVYALLLFVPRVYESRVSLLVEPRSNVFTRATTDINTGYIVDDAQVSSQIELIRSRVTLLDAIEATNLREVPEFGGGGGLLSIIGLGGGGQASDASLISEVNDRLVVARERDSRLVTIAFRSTDPELAAEVANAIAQAHVSRRAGQQISDTADATVWLEREIDRLREQVVAAERDVAEFRVANALLVGENNTSIVDQQLSTTANQISAASERRSAAQSRAQLIRSLLASGQSVSGVQDVQDSPVVQQLSQEKARLQGELAQRSATLLSNHPSIRALQAQIAEIDQQIAAEGRRVADTLEAQAQIESDLEQSLQADLDRLKVAAGLATREGVSLAELEREASAQRELLNAYLLRYSEAAARTDGNSILPDVRIVSEAAPSVSPVSPRSALILVAVALASVTLQVGGIIFSELLSGRALVPTKRAARREPQEAALTDELDIVGNASQPDAADVPLVTEQINLANDDQAQNGPAQSASPPIASAKLERLEVEVEALAAMAAAKGQRVVVIAATEAWQDSANFAERLTAKLISTGYSVAEIDAASGQQGLELGLTDLNAGEADFGDVVHRGQDDRFAFVPWGQSATLVPTGDKMATLVEALSDIYEMVIVVTGKVGMSSHLPLFAHLGAGCVVVGQDHASAVDHKREIEALGFETVQVIATGDLRSAVA